MLVVHQDDSVITLFYQSLSVEVHLYNYGEIGHFWVEGYEYLRQLEYRIAILRDKLEYLGPEFCTPTEQKLAMLEQFPRGSRQKRRSQSWKNSQKKQTIKA